MGLTTHCEWVYLECGKESSGHVGAMNNTKKFYLFMKAEYLLDCLKNDEIRVALPSSCNDPFELIPCGQQSQPDNLDGIGFICFSKECTSSTMWAHYADKHTGVCLEFELPIADSNTYWDLKDGKGGNRRIKAAILNIEGDPEQLKQYDISNENGKPLDAPLLMKVVYHPYRACNTGKTVCWKKNGKLRKLPCSRMLAAKGQEWAYEKEWRLFVTLDNCLSYHDGCYFLKGLTRYITKVMLGWKCKLPQPYVQRVLNSMRERKATCVKMEPNGNLFAVKEVGKDADSKPRVWRVSLEFTQDQWNKLQEYINGAPHTSSLKEGGYNQAVFNILKQHCNLPDSDNQETK